MNNFFTFQYFIETNDIERLSKWTKLAFNIYKDSYCKWFIEWNSDVDEIYYQMVFYSMDSGIADQLKKDFNTEVYLYFPHH